MTNPDDGSQNRIVFDDQSEAIEYANEVLEVLFDKLGENDCDMLTIERSKMKRSIYDKLEDLE